MNSVDMHVRSGLSGRFHQPDGQSILIVVHRVGVCVTISRHDEQTLVRTHGASSLSGMGPGSRWLNMDSSTSGGTRRDRCVERVVLVEDGADDIEFCTQVGNLRFELFETLQRGCTTLSIAIISSRTCAIVILSMRSGEHHERRRVVISTVGE